MEELDVVTPGFRFYPTEEELITFYLKHKLLQIQQHQQQQAQAEAGAVAGDQGNNSSSNSRLVQDIDRVIPQLHVYDFYPWDLPQYAGERCQGDPEQWFFFIPRQEKEARGGRPSRLTSSGYWKATGSPSIVYSSGNRAIGIKRTMVFYNGRAPTGTKTKWKMNEYKAFAFAFPLSLPAFQQHHLSPSFNTTTNPKPQLMGELSLCRVYVKSNCLRAFDRRPPPASAGGVRIITASRTAAQPPAVVAQCPVSSTSTTATTTTTNPSILLETNTTSSSSLSDHSHYSSSDDQQSTVNHSHSTSMDTHDQPLWDWEELKKWF